MRPAAYAFRFPRDGTVSVALILHGRDPRTGEVRRLPIPGITIEWTVAWPGGAETRTLPGAGEAALSLDARTGVIGFPLSAERRRALQDAAQPIATRLRVLMPDGSPVPFLTGTLALED